MEVEDNNKNTKNSQCPSHDSKLGISWTHRHLIQLAWWYVDVSEVCIVSKLKGGCVCFMQNSHPIPSATHTILPQTSVLISILLNSRVHWFYGIYSCLRFPPLLLMILLIRGCQIFLQDIRLTAFMVAKFSQTFSGWGGSNTAVFQRLSDWLYYQGSDDGDGVGLWNTDVCVNHPI